MGYKPSLLTFSAVLSLPARVAYDLPAFTTREVPKSVIAGSAEHRAAIAIVALVTEKAVGVAQLGSARCLHVFGPLISHSKVTLSGDPADQTIRVFYKNLINGIFVSLNSLHLVTGVYRPG